VTALMSGIQRGDGSGPDRPSDPSRQNSARPRQGSAASTKQMRFAARDGRQITFWLPDGSTIVGYLIGADD
jgi:hypothetical protein